MWTLFLYPQSSVVCKKLVHKLAKSFEMAFSWLIAQVRVRSFIGSDDVLSKNFPVPGRKTFDTDQPFRDKETTLIT